MMSGDIPDSLYWLRQDANKAFLAVIAAEKDHVHFAEAMEFTMIARNRLDDIANLVEERAFPRLSMIKCLSFLSRGK